MCSEGVITNIIPELLRNTLEFHVMVVIIELLGRLLFPLELHPLLAVFSYILLLK